MKKIKLTLIFICVISFINCQNLIPYRIKNKWGYSNSNGEKIIPIENDSVNFYSNQFNDEILDSYIIYRNGSASIIDSKGKELVPFNQWNEIKFHEEKYFYDEKGQLLPSYIVKKSNKYGVITYKNDYKIEAKYDEIIFPNVDFGNYVGFLLLGRIGNNWNVIYSNFSENPYDSKKYPIIDELNYTYPINSDNSYLDQTNSKAFGSGSFKIYEFKKSNKLGLYKLGKKLDTIIIIKPIYDQILEGFMTNGKEVDGSYATAPRRFVIQKNKKFAVIDSIGNFLLDFKYKTYKNLTLNSIQFKVKNSWGIYFFRSNSEIYDKNYRVIEYLYDDYLIITDSKNRKGVISIETKKEYFEN